MIVEKFKQKYSNLINLKNELVNATGEKKAPILQWELLCDYLIEHYFHGVLPIEYEQYEFYKKSKEERRNFICWREFNQIMKKYNNPQYYKYFDDKSLFNSTFNKFLHREWYKATEIDLDFFVELTKKFPRLFIKPNEGLCGRGAYLLDCSQIEDPSQLLEKLQVEESILEEMVIQHDELAAFNPSSVNTLRVVTLSPPNEKPEIMSASIRFGRKGKVVDNFHYYGLVALIDLEHGFIYTTGVDRDFNRYTVHPDSEKPIPGFQIPNWNRVKESVLEAATVVPEIGYVGWDITINNKGEVVFIEGNRSADPDVTQVPDQIGKWPKYKKKM